MRSFLDSNVLLYAISADAGKAEAAAHLIGAGGVVSVQGLNEFANVAFRKHRLSWTEIGETLQALRRAVHVWPMTVETHELGLQIAERYRFSLYDSLLVSAALQADCTVFYSEDLHDGQVIEGRLTIRNPFA